MKVAAYLLDELEQADMLEVDGLFAHFELNDAVLDEADRAAEQGLPFASGEVTLSVHCMDGNTAKVWQFSYNALMEAERRDESSGWWVQDVVETSHRIKCLDAVVAECDSD